MKEIRWHARAGQGAKTAAQLLAVALLREGKSVQAFPEYGPERRGAPMRAYTRYDDKPIRRHDSVEDPDAVVVLEPSLAALAQPPESVIFLVNSETPIEGAVTVAATTNVNLFMLGALAALLGEPAIDRLAEAAGEALGAKSDPGALRAALEAGAAAVREQRCAA